MAKISVIIPVYNVEKYLAECLDSVIKQTFIDIEILCVNDGSNDSSGDILNSYAKKDARIKIFTTENRGLSLARNRGLTEATGEWIYFLDSDDIIHSQCIETAYYFAQKYKADLVDVRYSKKELKSFKETVFDVYKMKHRASENPFKLGIKNERFKVLFFVWTKLYRKSFLDGIEFIPNIQMEDYPFVFAVLSKRPKTVVVREKLHFYRHREDSISAKINQNQIIDYHIGINYIYEWYKHTEGDLKFFKKKFLPIILKHELKRCKSAPDDIRHLMYAEFAKQLREFRSKNLLSVVGNNIFRYFKFIKIITQYA